MKYSIPFVVICMALIGCGGASEETKPATASTTPRSTTTATTAVPQKTEDQKHVEEVLKKEKLEQEIREQQQEPANVSVMSYTDSSTGAEEALPLPSEDERRRILNEIYKQLKQYQALGLPPQRDARIDQLLPRAYFDFDQSRLKPQYRQALGEAVDFIFAELEQRGTLVLQVDGHTDERGTEEYNIALGHRRAHSVYQFLTPYSPRTDELLTTHSFGEDYPAANESNEEAWSLNRRVQFTLLLQEK